MSSPSSDPGVLRSIAVTVEDVVTALEMNQTTGDRAVLRLTPPFSGRMRARLHVEGSETYTGGTEPVHILPARLVEDQPSYPRPAETEDTLRSDPEEEYSIERHRERHEEAVAAWRRAVADTIGDDVVIGDDEAANRVSVTTLGELPKHNENDT